MDQDASQNDTQGTRLRSRSNSMISDHPVSAFQQITQQPSTEQQLIDTLLSGLAKAAPITPTPSPRASLEVLTRRQSNDNRRVSSSKGDEEEVEMQSLISQEENAEKTGSDVAAVPVVVARSSKLSYFLLMLLAQVGFGLFFCYESLRAIAPTLKTEIGINSLQTGLLFSGYSFPAVFQMFGASAYDKYGIRIVLVICAALMTLGTAVPLVHPTFPLLLVGQIVFGLGGMNIYVLIISVLGTWFTGQPNASFKATFTLSVIGFWQRMASFASYNTLPVIVKRTNYKIALVFSLLVCIVSLVSALLFAWLYRYRVAASVTSTHKQLVDEQEDDSDSIYNNNNEKKNDKKWRSSSNVMQTLKSMTQWMKLLSVSYWCLLVLGFVGVATIYTFIAFGTTVLTAHGYETDKASQITSLSSLVYAITTPLFGFMVGGLSRFRIHFSIICSVCLLLVYLLFAVSDLYTIIFPALGAVQALSDVVVFSSLSLVVDHTIIGKATGFIVLCYNIGLFVLPLVIGSLYDSGMTKAVYALFVGFGLLAIGASVTWKLFGKLQPVHKG